jgi:hypothetical protein
MGNITPAKLIELIVWDILNVMGMKKILSQKPTSDLPEHKF